MYKILPVVLVLMLSLFACQSTEEENSTDTPTSTTPAPVVLPGEVPQQQPVAITPPPPPAAQGVTLNPPHGQPGHSCDVEVGQPLPPKGSAKIVPPPAPAQNQMPVMQNPQPMTMTPQPKANILPNAAKGAVNPPHGQPGHRCEIAVGAPLN